MCRLLATKFLPEPNVLPKSCVEAKTIMTHIGMDYDRIDACINDCVLYRKELVDAIECPKCKEPRFKQDSMTGRVPRKVLRHFPLAPRLGMLFGCPDLAKLQTWHAQNRSHEGKLRVHADCEAFQHIEREWPAFKSEPRHIRLGLAADSSL